MSERRTKFIRFTDLAARGIPFTRQHITRLVEAGKFPKPVHLAEATVGYVEAEIDQWIADRIAARDVRMPEAA